MSFIKTLPDFATAMASVTDYARTGSRPSRAALRGSGWTFEQQRAFVRALMAAQVEAFMELARDGT